MERFFDCMYSIPKLNWWRNKDSLNYNYGKKLLSVRGFLFRACRISFLPPIHCASDLLQLLIHVTSPEQPIMQFWFATWQSLAQDASGSLKDLFERILSWKFSYVQAGLIALISASIAFEKAKPVRKGLIFLRTIFIRLYLCISKRNSIRVIRNNLINMIFTNCKNSFRAN